MIEIILKNNLQKKSKIKNLDERERRRAGIYKQIKCFYPRVVFILFCLKHFITYYPIASLPDLLD